jgi:transcription elongation GreA/GreB family factor
VELTDKNLIRKLILVPEGYGGREFSEIKFISISTPIGKNLYGKKVEESVIISDRQYLITATS